MSKQSTRTPGGGGFSTSGGKLPSVEKRTILEHGCTNASDMCEPIQERFKGSKAYPIGKILKVETTGQHYDAIKQYIAENKKIG